MAREEHDLDHTFNFRRGRHKESCKWCGGWHVDLRSHEENCVMRPSEEKQTMTDWTAIEQHGAEAIYNAQAPGLPRPDFMSAGPDIKAEYVGMFRAALEASHHRELDQALYALLYRIGELGLDVAPFGDLIDKGETALGHARGEDNERT